MLGVKRHCTPIVLTVSVDGTDTIYSLGFRAFQISRTRNPNAITRCMLRRSSVKNKDKKPLPVKKKLYSLLRVETSLPTTLTVSVDGTDVIRCGKFFKPRKNLWITCMQHRQRAFQISGTRNPKAITRCMLQRSSVILALLYYKKKYCGPWIENDFKFWTGMEGFALEQHRASCCLFEQKPRRNLKKMQDVALPLCGPYWWNFGRT
jgi:hypothetical protein